MLEITDRFMEAVKTWSDNPTEQRAYLKAVKDYASRAKRIDGEQYIKFTYNPRTKKVSVENIKKGARNDS